jgi:hypothetical protein
MSTVGTSFDRLDGVQFIWHPDRVRYRRMAGDSLVERRIDFRGHRFGHRCRDSVPDDPSRSGGKGVIWQTYP